MKSTIHSSIYFSQVMKAGAEVDGPIIFTTFKPALF